MKFIYLHLAFLLTTAFVSTNNKVLTTLTADEILQKTHDKLSSIHTLSYTYYRDLNYKSEDYRSESNFTKFLDFQSTDTILGFNYQIDEDQSKGVYNGKEKFNLDKKNKTLDLKDKPVLSDFTSIASFFNSLITLKRAIPSLISDPETTKTLRDTTIENQNFHVVTITLKNKTLSYLGEFNETTIERFFYYKIFIDKATFLPSQIIQTNNAQPNDFILTTFKNISIDEPNLPELSWYYSTYLNEYRVVTEKPIKKLAIKSKASDFTLPHVNTNDSISLSSLKGNLVLLDFWTKNCGACIESVPKMNDLVQKFGQKRLKVLGINGNDSKADIEKFYKKNNPIFPSLVGNSEVSEAYGVDGFPTVVLISKKGTILYAGVFNFEKLEKLIAKNLKKK